MDDGRETGRKLSRCVCPGGYYGNDCSSTKEEKDEDNELLVS